MKKITKSFSKDVFYNGQEFLATIDLTYTDVTDVVVNITLVELLINEGNSHRGELQLYSNTIIIGEDIFNSKNLTLNDINNMITKLVQTYSSQNEIESLLSDWDGNLIQ